MTVFAQHTKLLLHRIAKSFKRVQFLARRSYHNLAGMPSETANNLVATGTVDLHSGSPASRGSCFVSCFGCSSLADNKKVSLRRAVRDVRTTSTSGTQGSGYVVGWAATYYVHTRGKKKPVQL